MTSSRSVMLLESWLEDALKPAIVAENNLAKTAFLVPSDDGYAISGNRSTEGSSWARSIQRSRSAA
jgi:hypothetical protein